MTVTLDWYLGQKVAGTHRRYKLAVVHLMLEGRDWIQRVMERDDWTLQFASRLVEPAGIRPCTPITLNALNAGV
jgi:hypothetical protein